MLLEGGKLYIMSMFMIILSYAAKHYIIKNLYQLRF